ncbi:hypothetical protein ES703_83236 [subsurface metagenome]
MGAVAFARPIQMKDISAVHRQKGLCLLLPLLVQQRQIYDELPCQVRHLAPGHPDILLSQFIHDLPVVTRFQKTRFAHTHQHVVSKNASLGHKPSQLLGPDHASASRTELPELACEKLPYGQSRNLPGLCLEHLPLLSCFAPWAGVGFGTEGDSRDGGEEAPGPQIASQVLTNLAERSYDLVFSFFLLSP